MPFGGLDWLALNDEAALEPDLPICDPHHHFWDLRHERVPYSRYLLHELNADIQNGHNVRSTVFIEARAMYRADGPVEMKPVGEVEFVQGLAAASASGIYGPARAAASIVGHANLNLGAKVQPVLEALQAASPNRFRGIRHSVTHDPHPEIENTAAHPQAGQMLSDDFRAGARILAKMGFSLEGWMYFHQLPELADFAKAVPDLPIVLNHVGGLIRTGPYARNPAETEATWKQNIALVAACPNVYVKLGGLGMPRYGFGWESLAVPVGSERLAADMKPWLEYCIERFTPARSMFESNFPVDKVSYSYNVLYNAFKRLSKGYSPSERAAMFHDTAAKVYRVEV
ncbi:MAG: amidohydrolase family protein [Chloroflexota bacterium]